MPSYEDMTVVELRKKAKSKDLSGYSHLNKKDLIKLLRKGKRSPKRKSPKRKSPKPRKQAMHCDEQFTKKYTSRNSPPYPANDCRGRRLRGNDGNFYKTAKNKNGVYRWIKSTPCR